jgi:hypothetical protein
VLAAGQGADVGVAGDADAIPASGAGLGRRCARVGGIGCGWSGGVICRAVAWPVMAGPGAVRVTFARATAA